MRFGFSIALISSIAVIGALVFLLRPSGTTPSGQTLSIYYAAGLHKPVAEIIAEYSKAYDVQIQTVAAGSGELQGTLANAGKGDVFIAADASYLEELREFDHRGAVRTYIDEILPIARQTPVIAVAAGNPKGIGSIDDLLRPDVRLSLADPAVTAIGRAACGCLEAAVWERLWQHKHVGRPKVTLVAGDLEVGAADAGIVWDATASQYEQLAMVTVPEFETKQNRMAIGILRSTKDATRALHFARYVTARDRGLRNFRRHGYRVSSGDVWAERPEISLFSGGLNWVATEEIVKAFQQREGCTVLTKAKGCGSLVGEMKLAMGSQAEGSPTDVYFACDVQYMAQVRQWFGDSENVSKAEMVIAVPEGNPQNIRTMHDLAQEGLAVGMCDAELSALGHLTKKLLDAHGLYEKVLANTKDRPGTAAVLVERVALGNLDAAIVYLPNQVKEGENVSVIPIDDPLAFAIQPIAVGNGSDHAQLARRLMDRILSTESRSIFEKYEFTWLAGQTDEAEIPDGERGPDGESTAAP